MRLRQTDHGRVPRPAAARPRPGGARRRREAGRAVRPAAAAARGTARRGRRGRVDRHARRHRLDGASTRGPRGGIAHPGGAAAVAAASHLGGGGGHRDRAAHPEPGLPAAGRRDSARCDPFRGAGAARPPRAGQPPRAGGGAVRGSTRVVAWAGVRGVRRRGVRPSGVGPVGGAAPDQGGGPDRGGAGQRPARRGSRSARGRRRSGGPCASVRTDS